MLWAYALGHALGVCFGCVFWACVLGVCFASMFWACVLGVCFKCIALESRALGDSL